MIEVIAAVALYYWLGFKFTEGLPSTSVPDHFWMVTLWVPFLVVVQIALIWEAFTS